jgi:predicted PurR-regulated permease PerM
LLILGVENSFAIAFICAILNIIPYLGPLISIFLMIILSATNNLDVFVFNDFMVDCFWLSFGFIIIQMLDNFILQPYIFSSSIKSHPLEVFIVIIFSGLLFGIFGLIIAIPVYTTLKVIYNSFFDTKKLLVNLFK